MKFGQQLRLKTVPEWRESYVSYSKLKRWSRRVHCPEKACVVFIFCFLRVAGQFVISALLVKISP
eukprot:5431973-Pleurochrysis_carterae.AAC.2